MPYTLITVTYGGTVSHSRGYETLRMCQEARSIALYGMTIAEKEEADRREVEQRRTEQEARDAKLRAAWKADHPGRAPTPEEAKDIRRGVLEWKRDPYSADALTGDYKIDAVEGVILRATKSRLCADGLIRDDFEEMGGWSTGSTIPCRIQIPERLITSAHCMIEMPDSPVEERAA